MRRICKEYFEDLYNIDTQEHVALYVCGLDGGLKRQLLRRRTELEVRVVKIKNGKAASKDEVTGEMINGRGDRLVDSIWRVCKVAFESGVVPEDWRSAVHCTRAKCRNYRGISLILGGKICRDLSGQSP